MIHVDVRRLAQQTGDDPYGFIVQTSIDGGGWKTQYVRTVDEGETLEETKQATEQTAKIFMNGCRFAGADVRATSCGNEVSW